MASENSRSYQEDYGKISASADTEAAEGAFPGGIWVRDVKEEVVEHCQSLPETEGIQGGVVCTGFLEVEKLIGVGCHRFFLEKKLPFQIVIINLEDED